MMGGLEFTWPIIILLAWTLVWKAFGLWHSAKRNNGIMFVIMLLVNSAGIIPIVYLLYLKYGKENEIEQIRSPKKAVRKKITKKK